VIGERGLAEGNIEYKARVEADAKSIALASVVEFVQEVA